jgi:hypothetical protein
MYVEREIKRRGTRERINLTVGRFRATLFLTSFYIGWDYDLGCGSGVV